MIPELYDVDAVSFDFFGTLAHLRDGIGRGRRILDYLRSVGLTADPWDHQILYEVFEPDTPSCTLAGSPAARTAYLVGATNRLFLRLNVGGARVSPKEHAEKVWELLGPGSFVLFPETLSTLRRLKQAGLPVAIVSNWQCGLSHLCAALGVTEYVDHVLCSAELGFAKPDRRIFEEACRRLGTTPGRTLHVGDTLGDDFQGASDAGLQALLVQRQGAENDASAGITSLALIPGFLGFGEEASSPRGR